MYQWALERVGLSVRVCKEIPSTRQDAVVAIIHLSPHDDAAGRASLLRRRCKGARLVALTAWMATCPPGLFDVVALLPVLPEALAAIVKDGAAAAGGWKLAADPEKNS
jgi:hypothetical protein